MATNIKKKKVSDLSEATDTTGFWIFGSKTVGGVITSVKFAFDNIISLFGVTQDKGQSTTLAPSQKLFTDEIGNIKPYLATKGSGLPEDTPLNLGTWSQGFLSETTGQESASNAWIRTGYIDVSNITDIAVTVTSGYIAYIIEFSSQAPSGIIKNTVVGGIKNITLDSNTKYIRVSFTKTGGTTAVTPYEGSNISITHKTGGKAITKAASEESVTQLSQDTNASIIQLSNEIADIKPYLATKGFGGPLSLPWVQGFVDSAGEVSTNAWIRTDYLSIVGADSVEFNKVEGFMTILEYSDVSNGSFIKTTTMNGSTSDLEVVPDPSTRYIRLSLSKDNTSPITTAYGNNVTATLVTEEGIVLVKAASEESVTELGVRLTEVETIINSGSIGDEGLRDIYIDTANYTSNATHLYVRSSGADTNTGTQASPVKTIAKAVELAASATNNIVFIHLNALEEYRLTSKVTIDISGKSVRFCCDNWNLGKPVIKGSKLISSGNFTSMGDGIYRMGVTKPDYQFIIINNEMRFPASTKRIPYDILTFNGTLPTIGTVSKVTEDRQYVYISLPSADIAKITTNCWVTVLCQWQSIKSKVIAVDTANNRIKIAGQLVNGASQITSGNRMIIENTPQSFAFDSTSVAFPKGTFYSDGTYLYYKLKDDETIDGIKFELPDVDFFFDIKSKCSFSGIAFCDSYYNIFDELSGKSCYDWQAAYHVPCSINCYSSNIDFFNCDFSRFGQNIIGYRNGSSDGNIKNCCLHDTGCGAIYLGERVRTATNVPDNITVDNNVICDIGKVLQQSAGIIIPFSANCKIINNDISRTHYTGITMGYSWRNNPEETGLKNNRIANNRIHHIANFTLYDLGAVYTVGHSGYSVIENNIIHDVHPASKEKGACVYLDESSSTTTVRNNLCYGAARGLFVHMNKGTGNYIYNNIFAYMLNKHVVCESSDGITRFAKNIIYTDTSADLFSITSSLAAINNNLYYNKNTPLSIIAQDFNAKILDPDFTNPANADFSIENTENVDNIDFQLANRPSGVKGSFMLLLADISAERLTAHKALVKATYPTTSELYN